MDRIDFARSSVWGIAGLLVAAAGVVSPIRLVASAPAPGAPTVIPAGARIPVALRQRLRSGEAKKGDPVALAVAADVRTPDGRVVLIPAGAQATGVVEASRGGRSFGRPGELKVRCEHVVLPDGTRVPVGAVLGHAGAGRRLGSAVTIGAGTAVVGVAAMLIGAFGDNDSAATGVFIGGMAGTVMLGSAWRGGDVTFQEGRVFEIEVARDTPLAPPPAPREGSAPAAAAGVPHGSGSPDPPSALSGPERGE